MPDPENEATLQATANLSPVSPSPVHSVPTLAVPALQHTVDTIDAMVAAAAAAAASPNDVVNAASEGNEEHHPTAPADDPMEDVVDDDSFDDAYGEEAYDPTAPASAAASAAAPIEPDSMDGDDYARTFDSPIEPQEEEVEEEDQDQDQDLEDHHVSTPRDSSINASLPSPSDPLTTSHASDVPRLSPDPPAAGPKATATPVPPAASASPKPEADPTPAVPMPMPMPMPAPSSSTRSTEPPPGAAHSSAPAQSVSETGPSGHDSSAAADIQQLVADLTAKSTTSSSGTSDPSPAKSPVTAEAPAVSSSLPSTALPSPSSLPPRPPIPQNNSQSYASQHHPAGAGSNSHVPGDGYVSGAPGAPAEALGSLPSSKASLPSMNAPYASHPPGQASASDGAHDAAYQRHWEQFMIDERQYMSEAKWDRFPDGSRIFIGNLSSDKVSKRDVFDIFHKFGRLAQISLKSAYGFVQYHTVDEGRKALEYLQGMEVKGRRIHLEISRVQEKGKKGRDRSSDRNRQGRESGRRGDKHGRDENRGPRNHSPRRRDHHGRTDSYTGDRGAYFESGRGGRGRSRSPDYKRNDRDYRRRSPSPYGGRSRHDAELEIPRRYGSDVPDVQIIMQPDVNRDFATWIEGAFKARGLKTAVMYLHPRIPKDQVIQRQAAEGVLAVVDLDLRSQQIGRIPIHSFDRSGGMHNVRFEQYVDLEPSTAAEIILRARAPPAAVSYGQQHYGGNGVAFPAHQFGASAQAAPAAGYPALQQQQQQPGAYPPPQQPAGPTAADIASLMGRVDNATLQQLLSTIQATPQGGALPAAHPGSGYPQAGTAKPAHAAPNLGGQVDIQAILGSLTANQGAPQHAQHHAPHPQAQHQHEGQYRGHPQGGSSSNAPSGNDAAAQVQNIMAQLARYRQ